MDPFLERMRAAVRLRMERGTDDNETRMTIHDILYEASRAMRLFFDMRYLWYFLDTILIELLKGYYYGDRDDFLRRVSFFTGPAVGRFGPFLQPNYVEDFCDRWPARAHRPRDLRGQSLENTAERAPPGASTLSWKTSLEILL